MGKYRDKKARSLKENELIRGYFTNKENGFFVEVGANDPTHHGSQTWHLENILNWYGILIEPIPKLAQKCRDSRNNTKVFECACVNPSASDKILTLYIPIDSVTEDELHTRSSLGINLDDGNFTEHKEIQVKGRTLNSILQETKATKIDLLSIDVEGAELDVLRGLNLEEYSPQLILLEDKHLYLNKHFYLKNRGYQLVNRTRQNCWYAPIGAKRPNQTFFEKLILFKRMYISIWGKKLAYSIRNNTLKPFLKL